MRPSDLDPERWRWIDAIFDNALETPPHVRAQYLDEACAGDDELRAEVEALLEALLVSDDRLREPASRLGASILAALAEEDRAEGRRIGRFSVVREIGRGGMGVVYLAEDSRLGRRVALKVLPPYLGIGPDARRRFVTEARAVSSLDHPNVATLYEIDTTDEGQLFMVFAFYEGETLEQRIRGGPIPVVDAVEIIRGIAAGLGAAHHHGIIHRDIKPSNVLLTHEGEIKLLDFGVAKVAGQDATGEGVPLGTVAYMSPERARGHAVDRRTDLWSLGVLLYEMLTGALPFEGADPGSLLKSILDDKPRPPRSLRSSIPESVERVVGKLLRKEPEDRYESVEDLLAGLDDPAAAESQIEEPPWASDRAAERSGRTPARWTRLGLAASILALGGAGAWLGRRLGREGAEIDRLAVLPIENLTGDSTQRPVVTGVEDALIEELGETGVVDVVSRTSTERFRDTDMTVPEIARTLDVDAIVEGSVLRDGDSLAITARLIGAFPERGLWAETYRGSVGDILEVGAGVARSIAAEIGHPVSEQAEARLKPNRRIDPDAYEAYLRGRFNLDRRNQGGFALADRYLTQAIRIDPTFAPAYAELAGARGSAAFFGLRAPSETLPGVAKLVETALTLDSTLAIAHVAQASVRLYWDRDWRGAERAARRALELNPSLPDAYRTMSEILAVQGRYAEALASVQTASELDRWSQFSAFRPAVVRYYMRDFAQAADQARRGLELFPEFWQGYWILCLSLAGEGQYDGAVRACEDAVAHSNRASMALGALGYVRALDGETDAARRILDELRQRPASVYVAPSSIATIYGALDEPDEAFAWLDRAYRDHDLTLIHLRDHVFFDPIRGDPRFSELLHRMGLDGDALPRRAAARARPRPESASPEAR